MNRYLLVALEMAVAALLPQAGMARQRPPLCSTTNVAGGPSPPYVVQACERLKSQLIGSWALVSYEYVFQDGRKEPLLGAKPKGILTLDAAGNFTEILARPDAPLNDQTTLEDTRARAFIIQGTKARVGRFWINPFSKVIGLEAEFISSADRSEESTVGSIKVLTADDLAYVISEPYGRSIRVVWKRAK